MKKRFDLIISLLVFYVFSIQAVFPQQAFRGFDSFMEKGKVRLEHYLDQADSFKEEARWKEMAGEGLSVAMSEWERFHWEDGENLSREEALEVFNSCIEERFEKYVSSKLDEEKQCEGYAQIKKELEELSFSIKENNRGKELNPQEAEKQWREEAGKILDEYISNWNPETDSPWLSNAKNLLETIGNALLLDELYDRDSLKVISDSESASSIAKGLAEDVMKDYVSTFDSLFNEMSLVVTVDHKETEKFSDEEWLGRFETEMDKALLSWEEAENDFLEKKILWETSAREKYSEEHENWLKAYEEFSEKKENWFSELSDRMEKARTEISICANDYLNEISDALLGYRNSLIEQNERLNENYNLNKETYCQVRSLLKNYKETVESWITIWNKKYLSLYEYAKSTDPEMDCGELISFLEKERVDLNEMDGSLALKLLDQMNLLCSVGENYLIENQVKSGAVFKNLGELEASRDDFTVYINGIINGKKFEESLSSQIISMVGNVLENYKSSLEIEMEQKSFHLQQMEKEYEITKAVYEYAASTSNLTEKSSESELNLAMAKEEYNKAKAIYELNRENLEKEYSEKISRINEEIEEAGNDLDLVGNRLNELSFLHSQYDIALEELKKENLSLEDLRFNLKKAEAICDFGNSVYLEKNDAEENLLAAEKNLQEAKTELAKINEKLNENDQPEYSSIINDLKAKEEEYVSSIYVFENVIGSIEELQVKLQALEMDTCYKRLALVSKLSVPSDSTGKLGLVKIERGENGGYEINLDLSASVETEEQKNAFSDFFTVENVLKENIINEEEKYTAAEEDLLQWTVKMFTDFSYFEDVVLGSLFYLGGYGFLNDVDGKNINPYDFGNSKYVLSNVDPDDTLDTVELYAIYRAMAINNAWLRIQEHEGWESDVARCILYKDSESLIGSNIEFFENYAINRWSYYWLHSDYETIRDDHTFERSIFGSTFMDSKGKLAQACMDKIYILNLGLLANGNEKVNNLLVNYLEYFVALSNEAKSGKNLNDILYGEEALDDGVYDANDLKYSLKKIFSENERITEQDVSSIIGKVSPDAVGSNIVDLLQNLVSISKSERDNSFSAVQNALEKDESIVFDLVDFYVSLALDTRKRIDLNKDLEVYYGSLLDSLNEVLICGSAICSERLYDGYAGKLYESLSTYENELSRKYGEICKIEEKSKEQWTLAEEKLNYEYNCWLKDFENQYEKANDQWNEKYETFLMERQDYISREYMEQIYNALDSGNGENGKVNYGNYIVNEESNSRIEGIVKSIASMGDFSSIENNSICFDEDKMSCEILMNSILEEQKKVAAKKSAYEAHYLIELQKKEGLEKVAELNRAQREWEIELVRNNGYLVNDGVIERKVTGGCTLFTMKYQKQFVHMYQDFIAEDFESSIKFSTVNNLSDEAIKELIQKAYLEYSEWETEIFGTEKIKGRFELYLGDSPEIKPNVNVKEDTKEYSFSYDVKGEITLILMDLQWNDLEERVAYDEFNNPVWDLKIVDSPWSPSLRVATTIAVSVAASIVSCGALAGGASAVTAAALASAITMANEVSFAALDLAGGYKTPYEVGKSLASSAVSTAVSIATAGIGDKIANAESALGRIAGTTLYNGGKTAFNVASNSLIMNGFDISEFCDSMMEKTAHGQAIASLIYGSVSSILDEINLGGNGADVKGFSSSNISRIKSFDSFMGESASSLFEYGYTGKTTLNLASIKGVGLFELEIGKEGIQGQFGMDGQKVGLTQLVSAAGGLKDILENHKINSYSMDDYNMACALRMQYGFGNINAGMQLESILDGKTKLNFIEGEQVGGDETFIAKSILEDGVKKIFINEKGLEDYKKLGVILQHEAERNGVDNGTFEQFLETFSSVVSHTAIISAMKNDPLYAKEISAFINTDENIMKDLLAVEHLKSTGNLQEYQSYLLSNYASSEDFWKLTWGGQIVNDGQGYLKDDNGNYINSDGTRTKEKTSKTLGAEGLETGLLNIINNSSNLSYSMFSDEEVKAAQALMFKAGLKVSNPNDDFRNYSWAGNILGQKVNMYDFFVAAGKNVNDDIFNQHYNNSVDLVLAQRYGVDLGFSKDAKDAAIPEELLGKFTDLVNTHARETKNGQELVDKYKFTVGSSDGTETSLYWISKDNPFLDKLLGQHDFGKLRATEGEENYIIEALDKYGCNFMQTISVPQLLTGNIFTKDQVLDFWEESVSTIIQSSNRTDFIPLVDSSDSTVNDRNFLLKLAICKLGVSTVGAYYDDQKDNDFFSNTRICFYKTDSEGKNYIYHFALGDKEGNVVFNPGFCITDIVKYNNVFIGEKR